MTCWHQSSWFGFSLMGPNAMVQCTDVIPDWARCGCCCSDRLPWAQLGHSDSYIDRQKILCICSHWIPGRCWLFAGYCFSHSWAAEPQKRYMCLQSNILLCHEDLFYQHWDSHGANQTVKEHFGLQPCGVMPGKLLNRFLWEEPLEGSENNFCVFTFSIQTLYLQR